MEFIRNADERSMLFIDLKTSVDELTSQQKVYMESHSEDYDTFLKDKAYARIEYNKISCCTLAYISNDKVIIKQLEGLEEDILDELLPLISKRFLIGHNIKQFILPTLRIKCMKYGKKVPKYIDERGLKPWEIGTESSAKMLLVDSMDFIVGNFSHYLSLHSCCLAMGVPFTEYGSNIANNSLADITSLIYLYYIAAYKDSERLSFEFAGIIGDVEDSPKKAKKNLLERIYKTKMISVDDMEVFKSTYKSLDAQERAIFKEIVMAAIKNHGHKDSFFGGDTETTTSFKMEIVKTIDE